jgi:hypothetical protein
MIKITAIIGGVLLMAGVALAGTLTSLDSTNSPAIGTTTLPAIGAVRQEDHSQEHELRERANASGEDLRGPCDEPEHVNDAGCTGTPPVARNDDNGADDRGSHDSSEGSPGPGPTSGSSDSSEPSDDDNSGHDGGHDD